MDEALISGFLFAFNYLRDSFSDARKKYPRVRVSAPARRRGPATTGGHRPDTAAAAAALARTLRQQWPAQPAPRPPGLRAMRRASVQSAARGRERCSCAEGRVRRRAGGGELRRLVVRQTPPPYLRSAGLRWRDRDRRMTREGPLHDSALLLVGGRGWRRVAGRGRRGSAFAERELDARGGRSLLLPSAALASASQGGGARAQSSPSVSAGPWRATASAAQSQNACT